MVNNMLTTMALQLTTYVSHTDVHRGDIIAHAELGIGEVIGNMEDSTTIAVAFDKDQDDKRMIMRSVLYTEIAIVRCAP